MEQSAADGLICNSVLGDEVDFSPCLGNNIWAELVFEIVFVLFNDVSSNDDDNQEGLKDEKRQLALTLWFLDF